jgi:hypothetical protein
MSYFANLARIVAQPDIAVIAPPGEEHDQHRRHHFPGTIDHPLRAAKDLIREAK